MPTKRKQCNACLMHTIVKKVQFSSDDPDKPVYAWLCSPCVGKYKED